MAALSPYLDQALAITDDARAAWLSSLGEQDPALAAQLGALLDEHRALAQEGFLENGRFALPNSKGLAGQALGPYTLIAQIGQGGMGSVWLARRSDGRFEREAAVKFVNIALAGHGTEERFKREGSILGRLTHPQIADLRVPSNEEFTYSVTVDPFGKFIYVASSGDIEKHMPGDNRWHWSSLAYTCDRAGNQPKAETH